MTNLVPASWQSSVEELRDRVAGIFDRWLPRRAEQVPTGIQDSFPQYLFSATTPAINLEETDNEITVTAELPGLEENDFHVELEGQRLILRGEKKTSQETKKHNYYYSESSYGSFRRDIHLPEGRLNAYNRMESNEFHSIAYDKFMGGHFFDRLVTCCREIRPDLKAEDFRKPCRDEFARLFPENAHTSGQIG